MPELDLTKNVDVGLTPNELAFLMACISKLNQEFSRNKYPVPPVLLSLNTKLKAAGDSIFPPNILEQAERIFETMNSKTH